MPLLMRYTRSTAILPNECEAPVIIIRGPTNISRWRPADRKWLE